MRKFVHLFVFFAIVALVGCDESAIDSLILGTSAQPPTYAHGLLLEKLQEVLKTKQIVLAPTRPYKKDVEGGEVALELSRVSIGHFDEILKFAGTSFTNFSTLNDGSSTYVSANGISVRAVASPIEFLPENQDKKDTLAFLPEYRRIYGGGDGRRVFWISGADSFASISTWTPRWKELFNFVNWVVVSRAGYEDKINASNENPLKGVLDDTWLNEAYSYERTGPTMHRYRAKNTEQPDIFVLDVEIPAISSTQVRALLKANNVIELQKFIQPAVLKRITDCGYYVEPKKACEPLQEQFALAF